MEDTLDEYGPGQREEVERIFKSIRGDEPSKSEHARELAEGLGVGVHFGEWWGSGIQRRYGLDHKRFSLFNTARWAGDGYNDDGTRRPDCCHIVPILATAERFNMMAVESALFSLEDDGSQAAPGFVDPEGVVVYHMAGNLLFKATIKGDDKGKDHGV